MIKFTRTIKSLRQDTVLHTTTALIQMYGEQTDEVGKDNLLVVIMLDLNAAFDKVDNNMLLLKLKLIGNCGLVDK